MSAGSSSLWKTLLLPPLFAAILYLLTTYLLLPYYRHFLTHSSYTLIPSSLSSLPPESIPFAQSLITRINALLGRDPRRGSVDGAESLLGDEELEEGVGDIAHSAMRNDGGRVADGGGSERRLSQELERGFRDSSDEEEDERGRVRR